MKKIGAVGTALPTIRHPGGRHGTVSGFVVGIGVLLMLAACGEMSLYDALDAQEAGPFRMTQTEVLLPFQGEYTLTATGGFRPYTFELVTAPETGTVHAISGFYQAPASGTVASVAGTDRFGARSFTLIRVYPPLRATPQSIVLQVGFGRTVNVTGGFGDIQIVDDQTRGCVVPYGGGVKYTAPTEVGDGTDRFELEDKLGNIAVVMVTVFDVDTLRLTAEPENMVIEPDEEIKLSAHGGTPPYTFSVASPYTIGDHLKVDGNTAGFEPDGLTEDAYITVTDSSNPVQSVMAKVIVVEVHDPGPQPLSLSPGGGSFLSGTTVEFTASGGFPPYTFERVGPGSGQPVPVGANKARYTVSRPPAVTRIRLTDRTGTVVEVKISIN